MGETQLILLFFKVFIEKNKIKEAIHKTEKCCFCLFNGEQAIVTNFNQF